MQLVRAKSGRNKLEVFDNRPFAIEVKLRKNWFEVEFLDLRMGQRYTCNYLTLEDFNLEWKPCLNINDEENVRYAITNYYQE